MSPVSLSPPDYPGAWPRECHSYRVVSACNGLWALGMFHAGSLKVIICSVTSVTLQWPSFDGNSDITSTCMNDRSSECGRQLPQCYQKVCEMCCGPQPIQALRFPS